MPAHERCRWNGNSKTFAKNQAPASETPPASRVVTANAAVPWPSRGATSLKLITTTIGRWIR